MPARRHFVAGAGDRFRRARPRDGGRDFRVRGEQRARSRLVADWIAPENREAVFDWLATIAALKHQAPGLVVVPGHDFEWLVDPLNRTGVRQGFSLPTV